MLPHGHKPPAQWGGIYHFGGAHSSLGEINEGLELMTLPASPPSSPPPRD